MDSTEMQRSPGLNDIEQWLREDGQLEPGAAVLTPLTGGVSCDILLVEQGGRKFVVKRALAQLRVAAEWKADVSRNAVEYAFYETMAISLSDSLPRVLFHNPQRGYFTMEYLDSGWLNWKKLLLQGIMDPEHGALAGSLMGRLHEFTWRREELERRFDTGENFRQLRTDPYLRATAQKYPEAATALLDEANRLEKCRVCLVHGDFSPKNLLVQKDRMILLDAEVAWFGDPTFDVAFLQTHFFLKGLYHTPGKTAWRKVSQEAWMSYREALGTCFTSDLEFRSTKILAALLLARVDGKSPVEYLNPAKQQFVRDFSLRSLHDAEDRLETMQLKWEKQLENL